MEATYQLKITLKYARPRIWRRVLLPADFSLYQLHYLIQVVMGWNNSHLHEFFQKDGSKERLFMTPEDLEEFEAGYAEDECTTLLADVLRAKGDKLEYIYDHGDYWQHVVALEKVGKRSPDQTLPDCLGGERAGPPEDCGGVNGFEGLLETLADPEDEEYEEMLEWVGEGYDPEEFDLEETRAAIRATDWKDPGQTWDLF